MSPVLMPGYPLKCPFCSSFVLAIVEAVTALSMAPYSDLSIIGHRKNCQNIFQIIKNFQYLDKLDVQEEAASLSIPTLVLHAENDAMVPFSEGRRLARLLPNARFVTLQGRNHALISGTPAYQQACEAIEQFTSSLLSS